VSKRSLRRYHRERLINNFVFIQKNCWFRDEIKPIEELELRAKLMIDNKACSCPMCGNPRKHFNEITKQEKINELNYLEEKEEGVLW
jgi:hypothetical protein